MFILHCLVVVVKRCTATVVIYYLKVFSILHVPCEYLRILHFHYSSNASFRTVLSSDPVINCLPSKVTHTDHTSPVCPLNSRTIIPSSIDHSRAVLSSDPVIKCLPSIVTHTEVKASMCPLNSRTIVPSSIDHSRAVLSSDPVINCLPSKVTHTEDTRSVCPELLWLYYGLISTI